MSIIKTRAHQIGVSATASQNFTAQTPAVPDGTMKLARGLPDATTQDILTVDAAGVVGAGVHPATGARSLAFATMQKFTDEFAVLKAASGWHKLPNGMIEQWGTAAVTNSGITLPLPIAFPKAFAALAVAPQYGTPGSTVLLANAAAAGLGSVVIYLCNASGALQTGGVSWRAIGY